MEQSIGVHYLPDWNVMRISTARCNDSKMRRLVWKAGSRTPLNNAVSVDALEDRGATDESDPASMRHAVELALGRCPERYAEIV
jgi:hypothetical protein